MALDAQLAIPYSLTAGSNPVRRPQRSGTVLAVQARQVLDEAASWLDADERFRLAHLAALRTAAAVIAERARPGARRGPTSAWVLLTEVAPTYADRAGYFAAGASKRAAIEFGSKQVVTPREADDLMRAATEFLRMVEVSLGLLPSARAS
jgi:hypothetical protein